MNITINKDSQTPIYKQIKNQIQEMIISNVLPEGFLLPPERKLSSQLNVNRTTVLKAYQELKADGYIDSQMGSGTFVLSQQQNRACRLKHSVYPLPWYQYFNKRISNGNEAIISDIMEFTSQDKTISFAGGMPSPDIYPMNEVRQVLLHLASTASKEIIQHSPVEGYFPLRESLCELLRNRGISVTPKEVMVLNGSQQGLDYAARVFISPGDLVVTENPTYLGAVELFKASGARIMGVPIDKDGMRIDMLETLLDRYKPKLIYTLPTFQNPSGAVMSLERRYKLLDLAYRYQIPILEDDPYGDIRYEGAYVPPIKALDKQGYVMYLSTFSKVLFMGFRVGWIAAPQQVIERFSINKQISDLHVNTFAQCFFDNLLRMDFYQKHLKRINSEYKKKRDKMLEELGKHKVKDMSWEVPEGGYYIWCKLPAGISQSKLVARAAANGVVFVPGEAFNTYEGYREEYIRLNFTYPDENQIAEGVKRLAAAIEAELNEIKNNGKPVEYSKKPIV